VSDELLPLGVTERAEDGSGCEDAGDRFSVHGAERYARAFVCRSNDVDTGRYSTKVLIADWYD
jgi:hypothetical protein